MSWIWHIIGHAAIHFMHEELHKLGEHRHTIHSLPPTIEELEDVFQKFDPLMGKNLRIPVTLSFAEIAKGAEKNIVTDGYVHCPDCQATGAKDALSFAKCSECNGRGQLTKTAKTFLGELKTIIPCEK